MAASDSLTLRAALRQPHFRWEAVITLACLAGTLSGFNHFIQWVELRPGVALDDPLLQLLAPRDFTWPVFMLIYAGLIGGLLHLARHPRPLLLALQSYTLMMLVRIVAMWALPLEPPPGMIALNDPLVQLVGSGTPPTKDLFFSGHTATLFLLGLCACSRWIRYVFFAATAAVAMMLLWQHVHYTVDILVAPFVAWGCVRLVAFAHRVEA